MAKYCELSIADLKVTEINSVLSFYKDSTDISHS